MHKYNADWSSHWCRVYKQNLPVLPSEITIMHGQAAEQAKWAAEQRERMEAEVRSLQKNDGQLPAILTFQEAARKKRKGEIREEKLARRRARCKAELDR